MGSQLHFPLSRCVALPPTIPYILIMSTVPFILAVSISCKSSNKPPPLNKPLPKKSFLQISPMGVNQGKHNCKILYYFQESSHRTIPTQELIIDLDDDSDDEEEIIINC